jgi:hypothetical protein
MIMQLLTVLPAALFFFGANAQQIVNEPGQQQTHMLSGHCIVILSSLILLAGGGIFLAVRNNRKKINSGPDKEV